ADVYVYVIDGSREYRPHDKDSDESFLLRALEKRLRERPAPLFVVVNKMDEWRRGGKFASQDILEGALRELKPVAILPLSAKKGQGVEDLVARITACLPEGPFLFPEDELTDQNLRTIAAELIQEQLFWQLGEELPYSCAVEIERYEEPSEGRRFTEIDAVIHVDRESQKPMVLGKGGSKIKEIGRRSREAIERLLGERVVLKTFVKVTAGWTKDARRMSQLGYVIPER
ncbi:MAG: GTPase Era, partial [Bdellovibrionales bacterium]|nr:GTPase Era [Bdellovibrionales bacterium]